MKKRTLIITAAALFIIVLAALFIVASQRLPGLVREKLTAALSEAAGSPASIGKVELHLWRGIVITDLKTDFAEIPELSANILYVPWLKETKIFIPNVTVRGARLTLERRPDKTFNIDRLIKAGDPEAQKPAFILVKNLFVEDLRVAFRDAALSPETNFTLIVPRARGHLTGTRILFEADASITRDKQTTDLVLDGRYDLLERKFSGKISAKELNPGLALPYIPPIPVDLGPVRAAPLTLDLEVTDRILTGRITGKVSGVNYKTETLNVREGLLDIDATVEADTRDLAAARVFGTLTLRSLDLSAAHPQGKFEGTFGDSTAQVSWNQKTIEANGTLRLASGKVVSGDIVASGLTGESRFKFILLPPQNGMASKPSYEGEANISCEKVAGIPRVNTIDSLQAKVSFSDSTITLKESRANVLDTPVSAMGKFDKDTLEAVANGTFDLADLTGFIPDSIELPGYKISGSAQITARLSRPAAAGAKPLITLETHLADLWLRIIDDDIVLSADTGKVQIDLNGQTIDCELARVIVNEETYAFSGTLKDFQTPAVFANLKGPFYSLAADLVIQDRRITFHSFEARTKLSRIDAEGTYDTAARTLSAKGQVLLNASDLPRLAPKLNATWERARLTGQLTAQIELSGPVGDPRAWKIKANGSSRGLGGYGYRAEISAFDYQQVEREGFLNDLSFNAYKGQGLIKGRVTFNDKLSWALRGAVDALDLEALKMDTPMKDKTFFGTAAVELSVQGAGADKASIMGGGRIAIKDGNVCEFNPLKGLGNFLFIPKLSSLTFTSAAGDVYIRNEKIGSDNLELTGAQLGLLVQGAMTFSGGLDFVVTTQVPLPAGQSSSTGEILQSVTRAGSMTAIEVTGTTKEPKYKLRAIGGNIAQRISDVVSSILP